MNEAVAPADNAVDKALVRFYVLAQADEQARLQLACQLCEKAQDGKQKIAILCADEAMRAQLDTLLWTFRASSFIPHAPFGSREAADVAVVLLVPPERISGVDVFINLSAQEQPDVPRACRRIFEIVIPREDILASTRARFARYRERGFQPQTHKL